MEYVDCRASAASWGFMWSTGKDRFVASIRVLALALDHLFKVSTEHKNPPPATTGARDTADFKHWVGCVAPLPPEIIHVVIPHELRGKGNSDPLTVPAHAAPFATLGMSSASALASASSRLNPASYSRIPARSSQASRSPP